MCQTWGGFSDFEHHLTEGGNSGGRVGRFKGKRCVWLGRGVDKEQKEKKPGHLGIALATYHCQNSLSQGKEGEGKVIFNLQITSQKRKRKKYTKGVVPATFPASIYYLSSGNFLSLHIHSLALPSSPYI